MVQAEMHQPLNRQTERYTQKGVSQPLAPLVLLGVASLAW